METKKKKSPAIFFLDIVIGLLCLALVFAAFFALNSYRESFGWNYDADSFYYRLSDGDYAAMVEMYYYNESADVKSDKELEMYYAVARYFEAASYYKAYEDAGDTGWAAHYRAAMNSAETDMGPMHMVAQDICCELDIEG